MYRLNFITGNKVAYTKSIESIEEDELLRITINNFVRDNCQEIIQSLDNSDSSDFTRQLLSSKKNIPFFIYLGTESPISYDIDDNGLLYIHHTTEDGLWTINKIRKLEKLNLVTWNNSEINFAVAQGMGAAGFLGEAIHDLVIILVSSPITALINAKELANIGSNSINKIKNLGSKNSKKALTKLVKAWMDREIYPKRLKDIILTNRYWDRRDLEKLLGADEITVLALMYSLGYKKITRNTFERSETEEANELRRKWD